MAMGLITNKDYAYLWDGILVEVGAEKWIGQKALTGHE